MQRIKSDRRGKVTMILNHNTFQNHVIILPIIITHYVHSYHELKEEPGLLKSSFSHTATAHHPLQCQFLMEELKEHQQSIKTPSAASRPPQTHISERELINTHYCVITPL